MRAAAGTATHCLLYDDGDAEELCLKSEVWRYIESRKRPPPSSPVDIVVRTGAPQCKKRRRVTTGEKLAACAVQRVRRRYRWVSARTCLRLAQDLLLVSATDCKTLHSLTKAAENLPDSATVTRQSQYDASPKNVLRASIPDTLPRQISIALERSAEHLDRRKYRSDALYAAAIALASIAHIN